MWASETNGELAWRVSMENSETGEKHIFASFGDMLIFLEDLTLAPSASRGDAEGKASRSVSPENEI